MSLFYCLLSIKWRSFWPVWHLETWSLGWLKGWQIFGVVKWSLWLPDLERTCKNERSYHLTWRKTQSGPVSTITVLSRRIWLTFTEWLIVLVLTMLTTSMHVLISWSFLNCFLCYNLCFNFICLVKEIWDDVQVCPWMHQMSNDHSAEWWRVYPNTMDSQYHGFSRCVQCIYTTRL